MKNIKKILLIPLFAIVCMFARIDSAAAVDYPFSLTTSSIAANGVFEFKMSAKGTFYVDCGTGGTLSSDDSTANGMISGGTINKTDTTEYIFKCTYSSSGTKTVRFGGVATGYTGTYNLKPPLGFNTSDENSALITSISGDLSLIFPYISSSNSPAFHYIFRNCVNITSIPETLFAHMTNSGTYMFTAIFQNCSGITSIPENLFSFNGNTVSGKDYMFQQAFVGLNITSIPVNLFSHISSGANRMFYWTFGSCKSLTSIPENLFANVKNSYSGLFYGTFDGCSGLTSIPENLFNFGGYNVNGQSNLFYMTFARCPGLTSIPANLFSRIKSGATALFSNTFVGCTGLTAIPENLFYFRGNNVSGDSMFQYTFQDCTGITSIPANLFSHITSGAASLFFGTFEGTGITSIPENLFSHITGNGGGMFRRTFRNCTGLTSLPQHVFSHVTSSANNMFRQTFQGCTGLTGYIPPTLFSGLIANGSPYSGVDTAEQTYLINGMMADIFNDTGSLRTTCPSGTTQYITGYEDHWDGHVSCAAPISLSWYDGNTQMSGGPSSCTLGGVFLPPTPPARTGYIFNGWKLTCASKIRNLDASIDASASGYSRLNGNAGVRESNYGLTVGSGQWAIEFSYGTVWGMANCNTINGSGSVGAVTITPESSGQHCWCQVTGFTASGNSYTSGPQCTARASSLWMYNYDAGTASSCATRCAWVCSTASSEITRMTMFGAAGQ